MAVVGTVRVPSRSFELGRILEMDPRTRIELEHRVPLGGCPVPYIAVHTAETAAFERRVRCHPAVDRLRPVSSEREMTRYALEWDGSRDVFFDTLFENDAHLLDGVGTPERWEFDLRFPRHGAVREFHDGCTEAEIPLEIDRLATTVEPDQDGRYGLTETQRETLAVAVAEGYYAVPREVSTSKLADRFDISDQAVTERLRRAVSGLAEATLGTDSGESVE